MVKKAIILIAGLGTRLLPLSKAVSKELLPLADKPIVHYLLEEALGSDIKEVVFIASPGRKEAVFNYLKSVPKLEKVLKIKKKDYLFEELKNIEKISRNLSFTSIAQKEALGDGHAILRAKRMIGNSPCAVFFGDDVVVSKVPCLLQLLRTFKTCQKPVIALKRIPKNKVSHYGIVQAEKIASRLYKIKKIVEKPLPESAPSDLAIVGRYVITSEVFSYLKKIFLGRAKLGLGKKKELILAEGFQKMLEDGKVVYGYEVEGDWLECGDTLRYLQSNLYFSLNHSKFAKELRQHLDIIVKKR